MKSSVLKNFISLIAFLIFVSFLMQKYFDAYRYKINLDKLSIINQSVDKEEEIILETEASNLPTSVKPVDLNSYYTDDNINLNRIKSAQDSENKEKLIDLLNRFAVSDLKEIIGQERMNYIKLYEGTKIVGDSNVRHFDYYQVLEKDYYYPFPGKSIDYQAEHVKDYIDENTKRVVFWNGYNIAYYKDANEYVKTYQNLVDKVKEINPNIEVYICSLMPATKKAIEDDLKGDIVHHIYRGKEYDEAIKKHFGDNYIDIKFMGKQKYYGNDGIHFMPQFYYMLVPYLAYYLSLEYGE